jgi:CARDB/PKD-like domain
MKKNCCGIGVLISLLLSVCSFGQKLHISGRQPVTIPPYFPKNRQAPANNNPTSCLPDTIILTTQAQINNFSTTYPTCTNPKYLFIDGTGANPAITSLAGLSSITQIINKLKISHTSITNLSALTNLTFIGDALDLEHNPIITSIGLNNLTQLGSIIFQDLPALANIAGLSNHITTTGEVTIDSTALTNLAGLSGIANINGSFHLGHCPIVNLNSIANLSVVNGALFLDYLLSLTSVGLNNLTQANNILFINVPQLSSIAGLSYHLGTNTHLDDLWIINTALTNLSGLDSLTEIAHFTIWSNPNLTSLHGLEQLTGNNQYGFSISYNDILTNVTALNNISSVSEGTVEFTTNGALSNLTGVENIATIGGGLKIIDNPNLPALGDFNNNLVISSGNGDSVQITDNTILAVCSSAPICNYLAANGPANIHDNAPGCNSIAEVQAACNIIPPCTGGILKTWNANVNNSWDDSLNWTPTGVPGICDSVLITGIAVFPYLNSVTTISGLRMLPGAGLFQAGYNLTVNGNVIADSASIGNGLVEVLSINNSHDVIHFVHSSVFPFLNIQGYSGELTMSGSYFQKDVSVSDSSSRTGTNRFSGNTFNHNFSITANAVAGNAFTFFDDSADDEILGDVTFTVNQPVPFSIGNLHPLHVGGNFTVNSNFLNYPNVSNGTIDFVNGDEADAHIRNIGTNNYLAIGFLRTNKGGTITLDQDVTITQNVHFLFGPFITDTSKLLIFNNGAGIDQYASASFVDGPVKKIGNQQFGFPVGDSSTSSGCRISAPALNTDAFTARYFHRNPSIAGYDTSQHVSSISRILSREYWTINRNNGNSNVQVSFDYDSVKSGPVPSIYDLRVVRWNGSQWLNMGAGSISGNAASAAISSSGTVSSFGPFALALVPHRIPVITIANADTVACVSSTKWIHFSLDTLMVGNNVFTAQLSDSSGSFASPFNIGSVASNHSDSIIAFVPGSFPAGNHYKIRIIGSSPPDTSIAKTVSIKPFPSPSIVVHGPTVACYGGGIYKYWVTPVQPGIIYNWTGNAGDTITTNYDTAYVRFSYAGGHYVNVVNANACQTGTSAFLYVNVSYPAPTASPVLTNTGRWLYSTAPPANQNATGYRWFRNDTLISGATNNSYYVSSAGSYKVKYYNLCNDGPASNIISFAAASLPQTINFPVLPNKTYGDPDFVIPATASSGLPVSFSITSGPGAIPGNSYHITTTGVATIRATQPGDNVYDTAAPVSRTFTISKAAQTITFPVISDKDFAATTQFGLTATSNSGLSVLYTILSGPATVSGSTVTLTGLGTITIRATQPGDTNYLPAAFVDRSFCVRVSSLNPISGPVTICPTINVTYSVNNIPGATYIWRIAGGSTLPSTTSTVTLIWPSPGTYTLIARATGSCGAVSNNDSLTITAITSVQPDSVNNMLPVNGAVNQQLPLTLSWIPANPNLFYTYDLYLWRADTTQPATPYVSNLTNINYTIPLNSGLPYGQTYKWMIAAHNGSCTVTTGGPIQTFSLIPLPDLQVYNVIAPPTALSGQPVSVTWKVRNNGPGNTQTGQTWTDAVFISVDSVLNLANPFQVIFPAAPLLVAAKPNVSALNTGQFYNDTATFIIPVAYSGTLYMHVVTNYAPPAINPVIENTLVNDTAHALPPTAVTLSPQPDLRVDTVVNPNNTFSGSTINVTFKVKNYNVSTNGNASWIDKVFISKDAVFNINTATLLKYPNGYGTYFPANDAVISHSNGLQQDSTYTVSIPVVVPNFIYGGHYVYIFTNADGGLYEGPNSNNNINHGNLMQVFLTATPKLTPVSITVASGISTTQSVPVTWTEQNQGVYDNIEKNLGHYWVIDYIHQILCPPSQFLHPSYKDSLGFGSSYWIDRVYLSTDSSGLNIPASTLLGEVPHGNPNNSSHLGPYPGQYCYPPPNENTDNAILPNSNHPGSYGYTVPANLPQGDYYIYVYANPTKIVYEYPGLPQVLRSNKITVSWPDLTVPSVTVPTTGNSGQPFTVNYTILNAGPGAVYNHYRKDYIYMGNSSTFNGSAVLLDSVIYSSDPVPVNISQSLQKVVILPNGASGSKFIFVRTNGDSTFKETNLNNNTNTTGAPVTISLTAPPDLQVSSIVMSDTVFSSLGFPFKYTVTNTGSGLASGAWKDSIFISCSNVFNSSTVYYVGVRTQQNYIPASGNYSDSFSLFVPLTFLINNSGCLANDTAHAYFFVKTNANNGIYEPANTNNTGVTNQKTIINALVDHTITNVTSTDSAWVGQYFKTKWTVKNLGYAPEYYSYYTWGDHVFMTTDSVLTANPRLIGFNGQEMQRLGHNQTYTDSVSVLLPNMPSGYYYLFVNTNTLNQIAAEHNLANNPGLRRNASGQAIRVYVTNSPPADLTDSITNAPVTAAVGQPVKIVYKVKNIGVTTTNTNSWSDDFWLSSSLQPGGVYLGSKNHTGALATGQFYIDSATVYIPINQVQGNYVIVVRANSGISFYENNYSNNLAFRYMSVYTPAPTDLVVDSVGAADTLILGKTVPVNWKLRNISNNPANGFETDGIYLGSDSLTNSNNDILIGTKQNQLSILPLAAAAQNSLPVVSGVIEGSYFLKVKTDIQNNILETNRLNNTGIRSSRVYVKVKVLPMNVSTPDTLSPSYLYYKLVVPAALAGKTIQVKLTSNDSLIANNQMYIGLGYIPSAAHFNYTYNNANYGNQQIVIESVVDSVYYIAAKGTKNGGGNQVIRLLAVELPFAITNVSANHGGNTGNVTVLVRGSLFTNNMIARLHGVSLNNNISASAIYFVNSTTLYATFNLASKPLGLYDVILKKPDSSAATVPSGFTIELTNNGGLITGTGPNTGQVGSGNAPGCDPGAPSGFNSQLQTELIIPPRVFASWPFVIQINYTNTTNVDIPAQVKILYSLDGAPLSLTEAGLADGKTSLYIEFKDATGPPNTIRAGGTGTVRIYSKAPLSATAHSFLNYTFQ